MLAKKQWYEGFIIYINGKSLDDAEKPFVLEDSFRKKIDFLHKYGDFQR